MSATEATDLTTKDITTMSEADLQNLCNGHRIKIAIQNPDSPGTGSQIIHESFPLALLTAFSPTVAGRVQSMSNKNPVGIVLHSSCPLAHREILSWLLHSSFQGRPSIIRIALSECAFYKYGRILEEARYLGIEWLCTNMEERMRSIMAGQVHSDDVELIYRHTNPGHWMRAWCAESVAEALWEKRLQFKAKYDRMREQCASFDEDVIRVTNALRELSVQHES